MMSLFKRRGNQTTQTRVFDDFDIDTKAEILAHLALNTDDVPVVASILDAGHWCLITSKQTIAYVSGETASIENSSIRQVATNLCADYSSGARQMKDLSYIEVTSVSTSLLLQIEAGEAFWGVYNVLSGIAERNLKALEALH